jgi:hypothetical protein
VEKTVRRAGRAWGISSGEMRGQPGSERSFLAGETERVFAVTNWNFRSIFHHGFGNASHQKRRFDKRTLPYYR